MAKKVSGRTSSAAKVRYNERAYDRFTVAVPKGRRIDLEACAAARGESVNGMINELLRQACGMDASTWRQRPGGDADPDAT